MAFLQGLHSLLHSEMTAVTQLPHPLDLCADLGSSLGETVFCPHCHMVGSSQLQPRSLTVLVKSGSQAFPKAPGRSMKHAETFCCLCPEP